MVSKGLLLPGVLLALAYGLKTVALPEAKQNTPSYRTSTAAEPRSANQLASGVDGDGANGYSSRLSDLILPLPPMALPELLLPPYSFPSFDSERLDQELRLYLQYLRTHGKPDVLIIGSSRSLQGIDPAALEEALAAQGHPGLKVYNFGINGATAQVMNLLMQDILAPEQLPRLVIWGDGSRAFNSGRPDRTYSQIVASPGYQQVQRGEHPIPSRTTDWEIPTFVTTANKSLAESVAAANETPVAPDLTLQGFQTVTEQYDPSSYYRRYPRVSGRYDNNYYNFNLRGDQTDATVSLANTAVACYLQRHKEIFSRSKLQKLSALSGHL
ncbi:hypothetical protein JVX88_36145 [Leptolyngbya sp. 7M]|nr:hypothetical protein JVX88_36145 [Leptolyngbya sp. 7M]